MIDIYVCDERTTTTAVAAARRKITTSIRHIFGPSMSRKYIDRVGRNELFVCYIKKKSRRTKMSSTNRNSIRKQETLCFKIL